MYLGDEQQAIFSFMGAKMETLMELRMRCKGHIHHLTKNHRSPSYLLDVFNDYASKTLNIKTDLLPTTDRKVKATTDDLRIIVVNGSRASLCRVTVASPPRLKWNTTSVRVSTRFLLTTRMHRLNTSTSKVFALIATTSLRASTSAVKARLPKRLSSNNA